MPNKQQDPILQHLQICEIAKEEVKGDSDDVSELLLSAPQLIYTFTTKEVISSVAKIQ